jgi:hypothetical protein
VRTLAFHLLTHGRQMLLTPARASSPRQQIILTRSVPGQAIIAQLVDPGDAEPPEIDTPVRLATDLNGRLWTFTSTVRRCLAEHDQVHLALDWPRAVEEYPGRRSPRVPVLLPLFVLPREGEEDGREIATYALDLSVDGARFAYPLEPEPESTLQLRLGPADRSIDLVAQPMWHYPLHDCEGDPLWMMGVRFLDLSSQARASLSTLVRAQPARLGSGL